MTSYFSENSKVLTLVCKGPGDLTPFGSLVPLLLTPLDTAFVLLPRGTRSKVLPLGPDVSYSKVLPGTHMAHDAYI